MNRVILLALLLPSLALAWNSGQPGNARTELPEHCDDPPYSTHDWIADNALDMLPDEDDVEFTPFLSESSLVRRTPYTAVKRISKATSGGSGEIQTFEFMDNNYANRNTDPVYFNSTGNALNMAANELADVLHTFFLNVVDED